MLLDTSGLLCYLDVADEQNRDAVTFVDAAPRLLTHNYVIAELIPLCQARGVRRSTSLAFIRELAANPRVEIVWVDQELHDAALDLLEARLDKTYSLCDAVSFVLMQRRGLLEALTTDHHFEQEGLRRLLN